MDELGRGLEPDREKRRSHLALIRTVITRMKVGSLLLKVWSPILVAALLFVAAQPSHGRFAWLALVIALGLWLLDAHYVRQSRLYHKTYERVQRSPEANVDFSLDTSPVDSDADAWSSVMFSKSLGLFHGAVLASIVVVRALLAT